MKILYSSLTYAPTVGGVPITMHELAKRMQTRGHEMTVRCLGLPLYIDNQSFDDPRESYDWEGIPVQRIPYEKALRRQVFWLSVRANFRRSHTARLGKILGDKMGDVKADLMHAFMVSWQDAYTSFAMAERLGLPVVFTPHLHPGPRDMVRKYCRPLLKKAAAVIALTEFERQVYIEEGVPPERAYCTGIAPAVMPEANSSRFRTQHGIKGPMVLFLARMSKYKNYEALAKAAPIVWKEFPDATFAFIGPQQKNSRPFFAKLKDPRIMVLGKVPNQEKSDALAACDLLCVPSAIESFGAIYCEAWVMGKPAIGGDIPAARELFEQGGGGYVVNAWPAKAEEIAGRILELLRSESLRTKMGESGRALVQKKFTWEVLTAQTERVYQEVLARR